MIESSLNLFSKMTLLEQITKLAHGRSVQYAGILTVLQRPPPAMETAFITFEDEFGSVDTIFKSDVFESFESLIRSSRFLIVSGKIQKKDTRITPLAENVSSFLDPLSRKPLQNNAPRENPIR